jgi:hypothetical protein
MHQSRLVRRALLVSASVLAGISCFDDAQGPAKPGPGVLAFRPTFDQLGSLATRIVPVARVRIALLRPGTSEIGLDTLINYPAGQDSLVLNLAVPVNSLTGTENFNLNLALIGPAGDTVFKGTSPVTVSAPKAGAPPPTPLPVPIRYVGTGSNAARIILAKRDTALRFGDTITIATTVLDSAGSPLPLTPVVFESLDTNRISIPRGTNLIVAKSLRGPVRVVAKTLTRSWRETARRARSTRRCPRSSPSGSWLRTAFQCPVQSSASSLEPEAARFRTPWLSATLPESPGRGGSWARWKGQ